MNKQAFDVLPPYVGKPHVFILGAGASRAAFPNGDRNGRKLPLMNDLIETLELANLLTEYGWSNETADFESFYSKLTENEQNPELLYRLEQEVFKYFAQLELPDKPTLYDHLVLCLRKKDLIATFNWDPFLWKVICRLSERFGDDLQPSVLYLHGNVAIGYCNKHKPATIGHRGARCGKCGSFLQQSLLLYPFTKKNYSEDPNIKLTWSEVQRYLKHAFMFTVFGYRAPQSDVDAVNLLKQAWGDDDSRDKEQIEIIDIRQAKDMYDGWKHFICREHYFLRRDFYNSFAAQHPRRSCEDFWEAIMQNNPQEERPIPCNASWKQLEEWLTPLVEQERKSSIGNDAKLS